MRITTGKLKGKKIGWPNQERPTQNRVKKAIFDVLGDIEGFEVLDLYAGSGSLGFEALSLGAKALTFVDESTDSIKIIKNNVKNLNLVDRTRVINEQAEDFIRHNNHFDLILADPPYEYSMTEMIEMISRVLKPGGILVLEQSAKAKLPESSGKLKLLKLKKYGSTQVAFYGLKK